MNFPSVASGLIFLALSSNVVAVTAVPLVDPSSLMQEDHTSPSGISDPAAIPNESSASIDPAEVSPVGPDVLEIYPTRNRSSVYFPRGSTSLTLDALTTITEHAKRLKSDDDLVVTLVALIEDIGSMSFGIALAYRRAASVTEALIDMGVARRQVKTAAGEHEDSATLPCTTEICRVSYRRVEFRYSKHQRPGNSGTRAGNPQGKPSPAIKRSKKSN